MTGNDITGTFELTPEQRKELLRKLRKDCLGSITLVQASSKKDVAFYVLGGGQPCTEPNSPKELARRIGYLGNSLRLDEIGAYLEGGMESMDREYLALLLQTRAEVKTQYGHVRNFFNPKVSNPKP